MLSSVARIYMTVISWLKQGEDIRSTMTDKRASTRYHRRLPKVPTRRTNRDGWINYRDSELWLLRHQDVLNKAISILELHPRLLQHRSCDRLWDFITKISVYKHDEHTLIEHIHNGNHEENTQFGHPQIPTISVCDSNIHQCARIHPSVQKVYICGETGDTKWHRLVIGLCEKFLVKYCSDETAETDNNNSNECQKLFDADVVLFMIDECTLRDLACLKLLQTAWKQGIRVLFIKQDGFDLSEHLPVGDAIKDHTTDIQTRNRLSNRRFISTAIDPVSRFDADERCSSSIDPNVHYDRCDKNDRNDLSPIATAVEIVRQITVLNTSETSKTSNPLSVMDSAIWKGYKHALTYNSDHPSKSINAIIEAIEHNVTHPFPSREKYEPCHEYDVTNDSDTHTDDVTEDTATRADDVKNDSDTHTDDVVPAIGSRNGPRRERKPPGCRRQSVDTVFFVCRSDLTNSKEEPSIVEYPWELDEAKVPPSPSMDSFGFQDIDLSKAINELDLFMEDGDEGLSSLCI